MRRVIAVKVTLEGDQTDLKNSSSHGITAQRTLLGAIRTLMFLMSLKIGSFHTFLTVTVRAVYSFLRAGRSVFLHKKEKKIIVPLFAYCLTFSSRYIVLQQWQEYTLNNSVVLVSLPTGVRGWEKLIFFSAERIEKQQTRFREEISREYEGL